MFLQAIGMKISTLHPLAVEERPILHDIAGPRPRASTWQLDSTSRDEPNASAGRRHRQSHIHNPTDAALLGLRACVHASDLGPVRCDMSE